LGKSRTANVLVSGLWSKQCLNEIRKHAKVNVVADFEKSSNCAKTSPANTWKIDREGSFFSFCHNETVNGITLNFESFPFHMVPKEMPICVDMTSSVGTCEIPWDKLGVVYMSA
jgi:phosphoserine aminotransferase